MKRGYFIIFCYSLILISCQNEKPQTAEGSTDLSEIEVIKVDVENKADRIDFYEIFTDFKLIPLQTTDESLIGEIARISFFDKRIYVLDKQTNSVHVFDDGGKFVRNIGRIGQGGGEYMGLMDFTLDKKNKQIILHAHRPYGLFIYDLNGDFIKKRDLDNYYMSISADNGKLVLINQRAELGYLFFTEDLKDKSEEKYVTMPVEGKLFDSYVAQYPYLVQSSGTFGFFQFSNVVYQYANGKVFPRYRVDFGSKTLPEHYYDGKMSPSDIHLAALENGYGFGIGHFRETQDFICFSYGSNIMVIYSKKTKQSKVFEFAPEKGGLTFQGYFGHDGTDNTLIGIYEAGMFTRQMEIYKNKSILWEKVPDHVKRVAAEVTPNSNPVLMQCTLRRDTTSAML